MEWISVEKQLPPHDTPVLAAYPAYNKKGGEPILAVLILDGELGHWYFAHFDFDEDVSRPYDPTHWAALPAPPKD